MNIPELSIIIPVYNVEKYLDRCLQSVLAQTYSDWEMILVDDGSTDSSGEICEHYAAEYDRIKVIHTLNSGQSHARNLALDVARGKYITFIDSDDYILSDETFRQTVNYIKSHQDADIVQFPYKGEGWNNSNEGFHNHGGIFKISGEKECLENFGLEGLGGKIYPAPWAKIYKSVLFRDIRFVEGMVFEDSLMMTELFKIAKNVHLIDDGCYAYMFNTNGTMAGGLTVKKANDALLSHLYTLESCRLEDINRIKYADFWNVIFHDAYCAVSFFQKNIFPKTTLKTLWQLRPVDKPINKRRQYLMFSISNLIGIHNFMRLTALFSKFRHQINKL